jgi:GH24 family phage-related lysozyme (muramidase)
MKLSTRGVELIQNAEGFSPTVYDDNGRPAIGFGHDLMAGESFLAGISREDATALLEADCQPILDYLQTHHPGATQNQVDALCSFAYNLGLHSLITMLGHGWAQVPEQMLRWVNINGIPSTGLKVRRQEEADLFSSPEATTS